jgi:histone deacetylase complex subunit SAP18
LTRKDATLRELVTSLRALPPNPLSSTLRHLAARFQFRLVFADPTARGRIATKDLGTIHSRDILPSASLTILEDDANDSAEKERERERKASAEERTLEELRVQPGDWLSVSVILPAKVMGTVPASSSGLSIRGGAAANGGKPSDNGWAGATAGPAPTHGKWSKADPDVPGPGPGTSHWRGGGRGGGPVRSGVGRGGQDDRRVRRDSPPRRGGLRRGSPDRSGDRFRDRRRSRSRTRSPPPRNRRGS